jgi:hypothetical protein
MVSIVDGVERRRAVVDYILAHPHQYTVDDIEWVQRVFGCTESELREMFVTANRMAAVYLDDTPLYAFIVDDQGQIHTLSDVRMTGHAVYLTKCLLRFARSPEGTAFLRGTIGIADNADLTGSTSFIPAWGKALGYVPYAEREVPGQNQTMAIFYRQENP